MSIGERHDHRVPPRACGLVLVHPQRGSLADGHWDSSPTWQAIGRSPGQAARSRPIGPTPPRSRRWQNGASTSQASTPSRGPTRSCVRPTSWSAWAAATPVPSTPAAATSTGLSTTPPVSTSRRAPDPRRDRTPRACAARRAARPAPCLTPPPPVASARPRRPGHVGGRARRHRRSDRACRHPRSVRPRPRSTRTVAEAVQASGSARSCAAIAARSISDDTAAMRPSRKR